MDQDQDIETPQDIEGGDYQDDTGRLESEPVDTVEAMTRGSDYESTPGRVFIGGSDELNLERVDLTSGGRSQGGGDGSDWDANFAGKGMTAVDGTGYVADTRGDRSYIGQHGDIDDETHADLQAAGLRLGLNSVDTNSAAFALANSAFIRSRERWRMTSQSRRLEIYAARKTKRQNRDWAEVREDSIHRHFQKVFKGFLKDRSEADPHWQFCDPETIASWDGVDSRSARSIALSWRWDQDEKNLQAMSIRYASLTEGIKADSIRARMKKKPHLRDLALFVLVQDLLACGAVGASGFDLDELLADPGGELVSMQSAVSERERRDFIINSAHEYLAKGNLFPPYCWEPINPVLDAVVSLLEDEGVPLLAPETEVDWSLI